MAEYLGAVLFTSVNDQFAANSILEQWCSKFGHVLKDKISVNIMPPAGKADQIAQKAQEIGCKSVVLATAPGIQTIDGIFMTLRNVYGLDVEQARG